MGVEALMDVDAYRMSGWMHNTIQYYDAVRDSQWGFPLVSLVAFVALCMWTWQLVKPTVEFILGVVAVNVYYSGFGRKFRTIKGRMNMRRNQREKEDRWFADQVAHILTEGRIEGHLSASRAYKMMNKLGCMCGIKDLINKIPLQKRQQELKHRLMKKHGSKVIVLAKARKERATTSKKASLKDRVAQASRKQA